eukprot:3095038-Amphidinium_carterae.1
MELDTGRHILCVIRKLNFPSFLVPVRTPKDDVGEVLRFRLTANTEFPNMKSTVRSHLMPNTP